ncbi:MAG: TonB-dependent receptor [Sphingobium sp.]
MKEHLLLGVASAFVWLSAPAFAQSEPQPNASIGDADIVVTATRSETLLSKTPITMTALGAASLRDAGVTDARALTNSVPNLAISENGDSVRISIRGVTSTDTTDKGDPSAAFLLDGIYIGRPASTLGSFYDLDRVEVLRGPQGTLYGRNTTAGVVNVISKRPTDRFEASLDGSYGNFGKADVTGMINVPVGEGLGVRAAVNYQRQEDPYYRLATPDTVNRGAFRDAIGGRLSFGGTVGDNFTFVIRGDYSETKGYGTNGNPVTLDRFFTNVGVAGEDPIYVDHGSKYQRTMTAAITDRTRRHEKQWGIMGEATYDFGPVQLTYLGSYRKADRDNIRSVLLFNAFNNPIHFIDSFKQNSQELRLAFGQGQPLHGQVGGYYFKETGHQDNILFNPLAGMVQENATTYAFLQGPEGSKSKAVFGTLTYDLTPDLHITGGVRYTDDLKWRTGRTIVEFADPADYPDDFICSDPVNLSGSAVRCTLNQNIARKKFRKTTWKAGIDYDMPGLGLIYASVSTGYKAGGFNDGCVQGEGVGCEQLASSLYYDPETLTAYEAGIKFRISSEFRLNAAVFHYDYKNMQVSQLVTVPVPGTLITNAASSKVDGVEVEAVLQPSANDKFDLGFNYTKARYGNFVPDPVNSPDFNFKGRPLDHAAKYVVTAGYVRSFPLGNGGKVDLAGRTRFSSGYSIIDLNNLSFFRQPSFTKSDATLTYTAPEGRYYVQGFIRNIENNITISSASTGIVSLANIEEPRAYGVRAGVKF